MIVMPANSTGAFWSTLAHETGRIGHLYSPGAQRGPWPWFSYALDNAMFACWDRSTNTVDEAKWRATEPAWRRLLFWSQVAPQKPRWAIVPDVPGNGPATLERWNHYIEDDCLRGVNHALAVQDGITPAMVDDLRHRPDVICVGGTDEWKWSTAQMWCQQFPRVHVLRCNAPAKLAQLEDWGCESTDGTGWARGDRKQTEGLERWARRNIEPDHGWLYPHVCRNEHKAKRQHPGHPTQEAFA